MRMHWLSVNDGSAQAIRSLFKSEANLARHLEVRTPHGNA